MADLPEKTILLVEDDADIRDVLAESLTFEGYRVAVAQNGAEALDQLRRGLEPALVLLDLMMPVMDGWQLKGELEKDQKLALIPVLVLSADGNIQAKAARMAAQGFIRKPVNLDLLLETIERFATA